MITGIVAPELFPSHQPPPPLTILRTQQPEPQLPVTNLFPSVVYTMLVIVLFEETIRKTMIIASQL